MSVMFGTTPAPVSTSRAISRPSARPVPRPVPRVATGHVARPVDRPAAARVRPESRPDAAAFRRRRVAAGVLGLGLVFAMAQGAEALSKSSTAVAPNISTIHYRVHAGDTLWSIARVVAPHDDPRGVVDLLVQAHGSSHIEPGDVIDWVRQ